MLAFITDLVREIQEEGFAKVGENLATKLELTEVKNKLELKIETSKIATIRWIVGMAMTIIISQVALSFTMLKLFVK